MKNPDGKTPFTSRIQAGISYEKFVIVFLKMIAKFLLSSIRRSKTKFLNLKVFINLSRLIPSQFSPF